MVGVDGGEGLTTFNKHVLELCSKKQKVNQV